LIGFKAGLEKLFFEQLSMGTCSFKIEIIGRYPIN